VLEPGDDKFLTGSPIDRELIGVRLGSLFADVLIPDLGMLVDVVRHKLNAFGRVQINHHYTVLRKPLGTALKVDRFTNHNGANPELPNQPAAVPARRQRRDHYFVAITSLAARLAKGICFAVNRRISFLHAPVVTASQKIPRAIEQGRTYWYAALG
jgi:hypothetical protein